MSHEMEFTTYKFEEHTCKFTCGAHVERMGWKRTGELGELCEEVLCRIEWEEEN